MKTICWKELRENYRWALLALLGLGFAQWYALHQGEERYSLGYNWSGNGLLLNSTSFLAVTTFGCAAVGLLLGFVQILPELKRDRWASLLHRPVSRGTLFRGKAAGGLILYALATVPPFLFSVWLVATPGYFAAPFVPAMTLAGVADLCAGASYYFAALAVTLPRGGWFGVRLFPLLAAAHLTYAVGSVELFRVAVEAAVGMSLVLCAAGWAAMLQPDRLGPRPWVGKLACLAVVFYGMCGLGDLARSLFEAVGPAQHSRAVNDYLSDTGLPLRLTYVDNVVVSVTDPSGQPPADRRLQVGQVRSHLKYINRCSQYIGDPHGWQWQRYRNTYRDYSKYAIYLQAYLYPRAEQWFYLLEQRVWISFSPARKVPLERLGRDGFAEPDRPSQPFSEDALTDYSNDSLIVYGRDGTTFHSLSQRRRFLLPLPEPSFVYGMSTAYASVGNRSVTVFGVALLDRMAICDEQGALVATLPYHRDVSQWGEISLGMKGDKERFYLQYAPSVWLPSEVRAKMPTYYEEMNARGELLQTYAMPPAPPFWQSRFWSNYAAHRLASPAFFFGSMAYQKVGALLGSKRLEGQLKWRLGHDGEETRASAVWVVLISLGLAVVAWFWSRRARYSAGRALAWAAVVFAGGWAGFVVFWAVADRPQLVACPHCRRPRPTDEERCPDCGADWPAAPALGIEIFDRGTPALL